MIVDRRLPAARENLRQARAWKPRNPGEEQAKATAIAQIEAFIAGCEQSAATGHPAGGGR